MTDIEERLARLSPAKQALLRERLQSRQKERGSERTIHRQVMREGLPLSFAQERIWLHQQLVPGSVVYNRPANLRLRGALEIESLREALMEIVLRHESLRTTAGTVNGAPVQCIHAAGPVDLPLTDLSGETGPEERAQELAREEALRPFDLEGDVMVRSRLLRIDREEHLLLLTFHHFAFDAWSNAVLLEELRRNYEASTAGVKGEGEALEIQYADFAAWDRSAGRVAALEAGRSYWKEEMADPPVLQLPTDFPRPAEPSEEADEVEVELSSELVAGLRRLARREQTTLFSVLLAGYSVLLHRYTGEEDIVVGCPVAGRNRVETEPMIGVFINTLALRSQLNPAESFRQVVRETGGRVVGGLRHQEVPFQLVVQDVLTDRDRSGSPLFQVMFVHEGFSTETGPAAGVTFEPEDIGNGATGVELTLELMESGDHVGGRLTYRRDLWERETMERMAGHLVTLLEAAAADPDEELSLLPLLSEGESRQLLVEWNDTAAEYPRDRCLHEVFEEQAERTPDRVAVVFEDQELSYRELNRRANQLADCLLGLGVGPEIAVGLWVERSHEMIVSLLAVLKAGGVYVPLDPSFPSQRLASIVQDADVRVLVTNEPHRAELESSPFIQGEAGEATRLICLDSDSSTIAAASPDNPCRPSTVGNAAYVIYTSGSTGQPNGVVVEHRQILNYVRGLIQRVGCGEGDGFAMVQSLGVDSSVTVVYPSLLTGGTLHVISEERSTDPTALAEYFHRHPIDCLKIAPSHLAALLESSRGDGILPRKWLILGGEASRREWIDRVQAMAPGCTIFNHYGPTEATVGMLMYRVTGAPSRKESSLIPTGRPLANTKAYVLDRHLQPVPIGVSGELYIGGDGVARGYLNRPDLTAERFIPDPFSLESHRAKLYKTGDVVRWSSDGNIEFLGRRDDQVKIRGFRIEPGEIETVLARHPGVRETVVVAREDTPGEARVVAYVVAEGEATAGSGDQGGAAESSLQETVTLEGELSRYARTTLPDFMVPSAFVFLDTLPRTKHGKLDRRALPSLKPGHSEWERHFVPPETLVQQTVARIWSQLLDQPRVGLHENFFGLGGHSLLAIRAASRLSDAFQIDLSMRRIFEAPTVAELSQIIGATQTTPRTIPRIEKRKGLPLSFGQLRFWLLNEMEGELVAYNKVIVWRLRGALHREALRRALETIVERHEALRTTVALADGEPVQVIHTLERFELPLEDLSELTIDQQAEETMRHCEEEIDRPFDLTRDLMLRAILLRMDDDEHVLHINTHHISSDGWSTQLFMRELERLYDAGCRDADAGLPDLPVQYADFAVWQRKQLSAERLEVLLGYWRGQLEGLMPLELPAVLPRPDRPTHRRCSEEVFLEPDFVGKLQALCLEEDVTLNMALLAAFQTLLSRYSGQDDIAVGTPIDGRSHTEFEPLIGFFENTVVFRADLSGGPAFQELLHRVRQTSLEAYEYQDLPFEKLVGDLQPQRRGGRNPLFPVLFQVRGFPDESLVLKDIEVSRLSPPNGQVRFDLELTLVLQRDGIRGYIIYSQDMFDATAIWHFVGHYLRLLEEIVKDRHRSIDALPILSDAERHHLLVGLNDTAVEFPAVPCVSKLFEEQAAHMPEAAAVRFGEEQLSYAELNKRANQVARYLRGTGIQPGAVVAVCFERSIDMAVAVLAVLKAGGAYVPLDPSYPVERLRLMIEEAEPAALLTREAILADLPDNTPNALCLDRDVAALSECGTENLSLDVRAEDLAYLLFTSGSTGRPKAVAMPHGPLVNLLRWQMADSRVGDGARTLQYAPLSFDVSFQEIFGTWCAGGCLLLIEEPLRWDFGALLRTICDERVERLFLPVVALAELAAAAVREDLFPIDLKEVIVAGEALKLTPETVRFFRHLPDCTLHNHYGPTEAHVVSAFTLSGDADTWPVLPPIGRPISNVALYVLDRHLNPAPIGVPGELFIGGAAPARGYYRRPELTGERFVPDPFSGRPEARMYRTGDRACWTRAGQLEFLGRLDEQAKVRGFRIEPGEIEAVLGEHEAIKESLVVAREDDSGRTQLVAYLVLHDDQSTAEIGEIREFLKAKLPDYMLPSGYAILEAFPRMPNGKVDRGSLPQPQKTGESGPSSGPCGPIEEIVAAAWADVLQLEQIGVHDNFFELGGHSLLATKLIYGLNRTFGLSLPVRLLFDLPTAALLSKAIESEQRSSHALDKPPLEPVSREVPLPLSFSQERIWQFNDTRYNVGRSFELSGPLNTDALREAVTEIMRRHEALRSVFHEQGGRPVQSPMQEWEVPFTLLDLSGRENPREAALELRREEGTRPFDLQVGPPLRFGVMSLGGERHLFYLTLHHIVFDGASFRIFKRELSQLYAANCRGVPCSLPEVRIQCADFAAHQRRILSPDSHFYQQQLGYWTTQLQDVSPLELPLNPPKAPIEDVSQCFQRVQHAEPVLTKLKAIGRRENASLFMVMLAAFKASLYCQTGQEDILIGTYIDARSDGDLETTFGDFVNLAALRTRITGELTFPEVLKRVRTTMLGADVHKEMPFEFLADEFRKAGREPPVVSAIFSSLYAATDTFGLAGLEVAEVETSVQKKAVPWGLTVRSTEESGQLLTKIAADGNLYDPADVSRMLRQHDQLVTLVADDPEQTIASLSEVLTQAGSDGLPP